jgi:hypothetical protein
MADEDTVQVPLAWVGLDEVPVLVSNQALIQHIGEDEFVLAFGHASPPPLVGSEEEKREQLRQISFVPVRVIARFGLTRRRVEELLNILQENLSRYDNKVGGKEE